MYLRGAMHRNLSDIMDVFTHESAPAIFQATMSYRRYRFIGQFLSFDHSVTRPARYQNDKFAPVWYSMRRYFRIEVISVSRIISRMNLPVTCCHSLGCQVPYTYYSLPYAGKHEIPNEYYVPGMDEKSMYLVTKLRLYCDLTGRNISMDRYFTSLSIADWLLERNMTVVGTMKDNRVGIPQKLRNPQGRDVRSTKYNSDNEKKRCSSRG